MKNLVLGFSFFLVFQFSFQTILAQDYPFLRVGYLPNYRFHLIDSIKLDKLSHLCVAFANPTKNGRLSFNDKDIGPVIDKAKAAEIKILLTLAGGGLEDYKVKAWDKWLLPWNRSKFIHEIMVWVRDYEFDGVDVDLEWGNVKANYEPFILELRDSLFEENKLLTAALPGTTRYQHLTTRALEAFDYIFLMAYDLTGPWAPNLPGQHAPFSMAVSSIRFWRGHGVEPERLVLGLPFYGWDFSNKKRTYSASYGFLAARDSSLTQLDRFGDIYFNGKPLIEAKTEYALKQVAGVMFWEVGQDAFNEYSLVSAVDDVVSQYYEDYITKQDNKVEDIPLLPAPNAIARETDTDTYTLSVLSDSRLILSSLKQNSTVPTVKIPNYPAGIYILEQVLKQQFKARKRN